MSNTCLLYFFWLLYYHIPLFGGHKPAKWQVLEQKTSLPSQAAVGYVQFCLLNAYRLFPKVKFASLGLGNKSTRLGLGKKKKSKSGLK